MSSGRKRKGQPPRILWWLDPVVQYYELKDGGRLRQVEKRINGIYHPRTQTVMICVPEAVFAYIDWAEWALFRLNLVLLHELTHWCQTGMEGHHHWNDFVGTLVLNIPKDGHFKPVVHVLRDRSTPSRRLKAAVGRPRAETSGTSGRLEHTRVLNSCNSYSRFGRISHPVRHCRINYSEDKRVMDTRRALPNCWNRIQGTDNLQYRQTAVP